MHETAASRSAAASGRCLRSLAVFCGSRMGGRAEDRAAAKRLGALMAARGVRLIYGGGAIGLMGVVARTVLEGGGHVTGVIPEFMVSLEVGDPGVSELVVVETMHQRKARMFDLADGFVVLPGGLGTLDEAIEMMTWKQLQLHDKPMVMVDLDGFWQPFSALLDAVIDHGFAHPGIKDLISVVERVDDIFEALAAAPAPDPAVLSSHL